jgi:hypothetical protein
VSLIGLAGLLSFIIIAVFLYSNLCQWFNGTKLFRGRIERPWPWLAIAVIGAACATLLYREQIIKEINCPLLTCFWIGGGLLTLIWQRINHAANFKQMRVDDQATLMQISFMLGSFFMSFGALAARAALGNSYTDIATTLGLTVIAAAVSFAFLFAAGMIRDAVVNSGI